MPPKRVITVIGSLNTDLVTVTERVPLGGETIESKSFSTGAGGKGANQAVAAARLSRPNPAITSQSAESNSDVLVKMVGAVGADEFGPKLVAGMRADGIDVSGVKVLEGQNTGVAVILVEEATGENRILFNPGANHSLKPEDFASIENLGESKPDLVVLQLEIPLVTALAVIDSCKRESIKVLFNPAPAVPLPLSVFEGLEHLIVNETEAAILSGRQLAEVNRDDMDWGVVTDEFIQKGVKNVVVTLGSKGSYYSGHLGGGKMVQPNQGIHVVDTTCAGDTFVGCYAVEIVKALEGDIKWDLQGAVRRASQAAERTVQKRGAQVAIPWADEIDWI
jgi:ribokinase